MPLIGKWKQMALFNHQHVCLFLVTLPTSVIIEWVMYWKIMAPPSSVGNTRWRFFTINKVLIIDSKSLSTFEKWRRQKRLRVFGICPCDSLLSAFVWLMGMLTVYFSHLWGVMQEEGPLQCEGALPNSFFPQALGLIKRPWTLHVQNNLPFQSFL